MGPEASASNGGNLAYASVLGSLVVGEHGEPGRRVTHQASEPQARIAYFGDIGLRRLASRTCTSGTCGQPVYFLSDHLGSATLALDSSGTVLSETLYRASGEVRYTTTTTTLPTRYTYFNPRSGVG